MKWVRCAYLAKIDILFLHGKVAVSQKTYILSQTERKKILCGKSYTFLRVRFFEVKWLENILTVTLVLLPYLSSEVFSCYLIRWETRLDGQYGLVYTKRKLEMLLKLLFISYSSYLFTKSI